jgi:hypothetical protein
MRKVSAELARAEARYLEDVRENERMQFASFQAERGFCYVRGTTTGRPGLVAQTLIGAVYLVAAMMVSGGPYMS